MRSGLGGDTIEPMQTANPDRVGTGIGPSPDSRGPADGEPIDLGIPDGIRPSHTSQLVVNNGGIPRHCPGFCFATAEHLG